MNIAREIGSVLSPGSEAASFEARPEWPTQPGGKDFGGAGRIDPRLYYFRALLDGGRFFSGGGGRFRLERATESER